MAVPAPAANTRRRSVKIGEMDIGALKEVLAEWLEATRGLEIPVGLEIEEALERARELMPLILAGAILPGQVRLDEEFKDVLYGLVSLATRSHEGSSLEIQAVYRFIRGIEWPDDTFDEKGDLLRECRTAAREKIFQEAFSEGSKGSLTIFPEPGRRLPLQESESDAGAASPDESPRRVFERARDLVHAVLVEHRQLVDGVKPGACLLGELPPAIDARH